MSKPMQGVRVLEVADHTFVPAASAVLADWGADVIKIEHAERGDAARGLTSSGSMDLSGTVHAIFEHANRGKRSLGLDLQNPKGLEVLHALAARSDVFLTNKPPAVRERLNITEEQIREHNPTIVFAVGTAFGPRGPERNAGGYDMTAFWCRPGNATGMWWPGDERLPAQPGPAYGDSMGAMTIAGGIATALFARERSDEPQRVEVSLLSTGLWVLGAGIALSHVNQSAWAPMDFRDVPQPMIGVYRTADGVTVNFTCLQALRYWRDFCRVINRPDLIDDDRFATDEALAAHTAQARAVIAEAIESRTLEEVRGLLAGFTGQWTPVLNSLEIIDDPQVQANDYVQDVATSAGTPFKLVATPVQFGDTPAAPQRAPDFNEHGQEILTRDLGLTIEEAVELQISGAVT